MLDPRRLLTFREVAQHGSFSRAADRPGDGARARSLRTHRVPVTRAWWPAVAVTTSDAVRTTAPGAAVSGLSALAVRRMGEMTTSHERERRASERQAISEVGTGTSAALRGGCRGKVCEFGGYSRREGGCWSRGGDWAAPSCGPPCRCGRRRSGDGELVSVKLQQIVGRGQQPPFRPDR